MIEVWRNESGAYDGLSYYSVVVIKVKVKNPPGTALKLSNIGGNEKGVNSTVHGVPALDVVALRCAIVPLCCMWRYTKRAINSEIITNGS